jgi:hypothetical protein
MPEPITSAASSRLPRNSASGLRVIGPGRRVGGQATHAASDLVGRSKGLGNSCEMSVPGFGSAGPGGGVVVGEVVERTERHLAFETGEWVPGEHRGWSVRLVGRVTRSGMRTRCGSVSGI